MFAPFLDAGSGRSKRVGWLPMPPFMRSRAKRVARRPGIFPGEEAEQRRGYAQSQMRKIPDSRAGADASGHPKRPEMSARLPGTHQKRGDVRTRSRLAQRCYGAAGNTRNRTEMVTIDATVVTSMTVDVRRT